MATTHPELAKELVGTDPTTVIAGTNKTLNWSCSKCSFKWLSKGSNRTALGRGCPACSNQVVVAGRNDMATTHPELAKELIGTDPTTVMAGTCTKLQWRCRKCDNEYRATGNNRLSGSCGCPECSETGFKLSKPSFLYLVKRPGQFKYGISNHGATRLEKHYRKGWSLIETIDGPGHSINALESALDIAMRASGIPTGPEAFREQFDGWTEAWNAVDLDVNSIQDLCIKVRVKLDAYLSP
jgi:hypothetical protein